MSDSSDSRDEARAGLVRLDGISSRAFEHPADRAALAALRKVPGFDLVLRKLLNLIGERGLRYLYLASAVRVTERQFPKLHTLYTETLEALDFDTVPELYVSQTPFVNAGAVGVDQPFIVLNTGSLILMNDDELRFILGHELGHIMCDHVLYKTMLKLLLGLSLSRLGIPIGSLVLFAIVAALTEWDRKAELSCDRAGLLALQDPWKAYTVFMKMAGGSRVDEMDIAEFSRQAEEYEAGGTELDGIYKFLNLVGRSHPFNVMRLAELRGWVERGDYQRIIEGDYLRQDDEGRESVYDEFKASAQSYKSSYEESKDPLISFIRSLGSQVSETSGSLWSSLKGRFSKGEEGESEPTEDGADE